MSRASTTPTPERPKQVAEFINDALGSHVIRHPGMVRAYIIQLEQLAAQRPVEASPLPGDIQDALRIARSYSICGQLIEDDEVPQPGTAAHEHRIACELSEALLWFAAHPTKAESQEVHPVDLMSADQGENTTIVRNGGKSRAVSLDALFLAESYQAEIAALQETVRAYEVACGAASMVIQQIAFQFKLNPAWQKIARDTVGTINAHLAAKEADQEQGSG